MTIKRFINFPFLSVYRSSVFALVLFAGVAGGAPKQPGIPNQDSIKVYNMSARLDSLTLEVRKAELHKDYIEKSTDGLIRENTFIRNAFWGFIAGQMGILALITAGLSVFIQKRTEGERQNVAVQVREMVKPEIDSKIEAQNVQYNDLTTRFNGFNTNHMEYAVATETKLASHESTLNTLKMVPDLFTNVLEMSKSSDARIKGLLVTLMIRLVEISGSKGDAISAVKLLVHALQVYDRDSEMGKSQYEIIIDSLRMFILDTPLAKSPPEIRISIERAYDKMNSPDVATFQNYFRGDLPRQYAVPIPKT